MEGTLFDNILIHKTLDSVDLKESYFYLDSSQEPVIRKWGDVVNSNLIIQQLPCWVPQRFVSVQLFGSNATKAIENAEQHNGPGVWATQFSNVHSTFNFQEPRITIENEEYGGPEQYFQLMKSKGLPGHEDIKRKMVLATPEEAYSLGRFGGMRNDWEKQKIEVMKKAIHAKFSQHPNLKQLLISSFPHNLVQIKPGDGCWGTGNDGKGQNLLGVMLMELRESLLFEDEET